MTMMRTCREVTQLVLQAQDRRLTLGERLGLQLHWRICEGCRRFKRQTEQMRAATDAWRRYRDE